MHPNIISSFNRLKDILESSPLEDRFKGYDPFDGLNSPLIKKTFLGKSRFIRLVWVQLFKLNPINVRRLVGIKKEENPQALAIFLSSYCQLYKSVKEERYLESITYLANRIIALKLNIWSGACWSYPFSWQARAFYQPDNTPLIIPTAYCFNSLLEAYDVTHNIEYKNVALSVANFVLKDLNRSSESDTFAFSYSPFDNSVVFNASLMASQILARCYNLTSKNEYKEAAYLSVKYCIQQQQENGSWTYGEQSFHQWIDNFHSGYIIVCLLDYAQYCNDPQFNSNIERGINYYLNTFFDKYGFSKYYHNKKFPLDINNTAQLIITLTKAKKINTNKELVNSVLNHSISTMQSNQGWFYYQKHKWFTNKTIYLRWSNSWMFYAYSLLSKNAES